VCKKHTGENTKPCLVFINFPIAYNWSRFSIGASWLATLGPHVADFSTLKLYVDGHFVTSQGKKSNYMIQVEFHHLRRLQNTNSTEQSSLLQCQPTENLKDQL